MIIEKKIIKGDNAEQKEVIMKFYSKSTNSHLI